MSVALTLRIPDDLAGWLAETADQAGVPKGRIVREQLERARDAQSRQIPEFMKLAGSIEGPKDLSMRKGFSKS